MFDRLMSIPEQVDMEMFAERLDRLGVEYERVSWYAFEEALMARYLKEGDKKWQKMVSEVYDLRWMYNE